MARAETALSACRALLARLDRLPLGSVRQWHWMSSALCLVGLVLFSLTGITLNHAAQIPGSTRIEHLSGQLPDALIAELNAQAAAVSEGGGRQVPGALAAWLQEQFGLRSDGRLLEWQSDELYLPLPSPGADGWVSVALPDGAVEYERRDRGWIAYFNDLHKGRHTGPAWSWFIDLFALACLVFCGSGFWLLLRYAHLRLSTWPLVALGLVAPWVIILLLVH